MTTDKHPAVTLAAYAEMWACGGADHNARCAEVATMLRTIPALETERDALRQALRDIMSNSSDSHAQDLAQQALDAPQAMATALPAAPGAELLT